VFTLPRKRFEPGAVRAALVDESGSTILSLDDRMAIRITQ
jgi:hypothetical protein